MAGATLALAISHFTQGTLPVTLIEANAFDMCNHPGYNGRAIALAAGTCQQLTAINIWSSLQNCATPILQIQISDRGYPGFVTLDAQDYALSALGQVVELYEVGQRLFDLLQQAPGVTLRCPARATTVIRQQQQVTITLENGETLNGKLLVAADGARSALAASCGVQWQTENYHQLAIYANITTQLPHQGRAFERFTGTGPLALLPMSHNRCSLVWCHSVNDKMRIDNWSDSEFLNQLQNTFGWRLGKIQHVGQRQSYPLALQTAERNIGHRLALVGNAAQTLHPIAGQGFNLGLRDVMTLAETLAMAHHRQQDPGDYTVLHHYQQRRQPDREATIAMTDGLTRLFANDYMSLVTARNLGLMAMNHFSAMRHRLAGRTLGWVTR